MNFADKDAEVAFWKAAAIYLAECHAATAEAVVKLNVVQSHEPGLSPYDRKRFLHLAGICYAILDAKTIEELKDSKEETWAFLAGYLNDPDGRPDHLEGLAHRVAMRAKNALDD